MPTKRPTFQRKQQGTRKHHDQAFYNDATWRSISKSFRHANPLCVMCEGKGRLTPADCVDHIVPIQQGGSRYDTNNMQALCNRCHASKSAREGHGKA
jgi:5-methylcytosine-specific restriction protein A